MSVDISDLFGTQGIFLGMSVTGSIIDKLNDKDYDFLDVFVTSLDVMLVDSAISDIWTTIRYNETAGEWFSALPIQVLNNIVPNFLKTVTDVTNVYDVKYNDGVLGKIEKLAAKSIPGLAYAMPKQVDIYTGEYQIMYKAQFITELVNKLSPLDISPFNVSDIEKLAVELGINKTTLTGRYTINDSELKLNSKEIQELNAYYGKLNKKSLEDLVNNKVRLKIKMDNGSYKNLYYKQMSNAQKKAAFEQIMSKNGTYAKIKILTSKGYKYYASKSEYLELSKLSISNVYRKTNTKYGFVKN